jgi:hypothetical protein
MFVVVKIAEREDFLCIEFFVLKNFYLGTPLSIITKK